MTVVVPTLPADEDRCICTKDHLVSVRCGREATRKDRMCDACRRMCRNRRQVR